MPELLLERGPQFTTGYTEHPNHFAETASVASQCIYQHGACNCLQLAFAMFVVVVAFVCTASTSSFTTSVLRVSVRMSAA
jgi:hypothetical protein